MHNLLLEGHFRRHEFYIRFAGRAKRVHNFTLTFTRILFFVFTIMYTIVKL
jgi:hypothetical protein